ncbi:MAG: hypothetical protein ACJATI_004900 [Halioglobus sp.]|jgi:hypothetical protein
MAFRALTQTKEAHQVNQEKTTYNHHLAITNFSVKIKPFCEITLMK